MIVPDAWIANLTDTHLEQMTQETLHTIGTLPEPSECTVDQLLQRQNNEAILGMLLQERARRMVGRMMKETETYA
jgi:hypothetical protein